MAPAVRSVCRVWRNEDVNFEPSSLAVAFTASPLCPLCTLPCPHPAYTPEGTETPNHHIASVWSRRQKKPLVFQDDFSFLEFIT